MTTPPISPMFQGGPTRPVDEQFMQAASRLPTLYSLEEDAYRLLVALEGTENPEDIATAERELALVDEMLMEKTESYVSVIRSLEAMATARKGEADRLRDRAQTAQAHADWLRQRLLTHMKVDGRERIETSRFSLSIRQNPQSVVVLNPADVPHEYERTRIEVSIDKRAILEHLKATGEVVPGVEIVRTERLQVS